MRRIVLWIALCSLAFAACEPEATPFPAFVPVTVTLPPTPGEPDPVRYALTVETAGLVADLEIIEATALVEQLNEPVNNEDLGSRYDLVSTFGAPEGWTLSDRLPRIALVLNPSLTPLDDSDVISAVRRTINPQVVLSSQDLPGSVTSTAQADEPSVVRTALANAGYPDGFTLTLAHDALPGVEDISEQLRVAGINTITLSSPQSEIATLLENQRAHLAVIAWTVDADRDNWQEQVGETNLVDLFAVPISYRAVPGVNVYGFTMMGFPLASR